MRTKQEPVCCPDLNPFEEVFSQVKAIMKKNHELFQVTITPRALIAMTFTMVEQQDCIAYEDIFNTSTKRLCVQ